MAFVVDLYPEGSIGEGGIIHRFFVLRFILTNQVFVERPRSLCQDFQRIGFILKEYQDCVYSKVRNLKIQSEHHILRSVCGKASTLILRLVKSFATRTLLLFSIFGVRLASFCYVEFREKSFHQRGEREANTKVGTRVSSCLLPCP